MTLTHVAAPSTCRGEIASTPYPVRQPQVPQLSASQKYISPRTPASLPIATPVYTSRYGYPVDSLALSLCQHGRHGHTAGRSVGVGCVARRYWLCFLQSAGSLRPCGGQWPATRRSGSRCQHRRSRPEVLYLLECLPVQLRARHDSALCPHGGTRQAGIRGSAGDDGNGAATGADLKENLSSRR